MKIARIAGITIKMNWIFLLVAALYGYFGMLLEVALITCAVIIHEFAHTIVGVFIGVKVSEIEMFPFGGQARIESFHGLDPGKEILVAIAGPLSSLSLAGLFYFLPLEANQAHMNLLININLVLAMFNLIPVLPLDGGRVLRAALSKTIGFKKATKTAAIMGKVTGVMFTLGGMYLAWNNSTGINLIVVGVMLFWAAGQEEKLLAYSFMRFLIKKKAELTGKGFLPSRQLVSSPETKVKDILQESKPTYYMLVVVIDKNHGVTGIISESELIEELLDGGPAAKIIDCLSK